MIQNLIERYKEIKRKIGHSGEFYKYEAVQHFQQNWDISAEDFAEMLKFALSKHVNLIYNLSFKAINHIAEKNPVETRELFKYLFDESVDLKARITNFCEKAEKIIKEVDTVLHGMQDERSISTYLTFKYPEKYTFYKDSFYTKFCDLLVEKKARKGQKYIHYLNLIKEFKEKYIKGDKQLWELTNATLPENAWKDENMNILAQDILFVGLDQFSEPNYWVFQGNPKFYDIVGSLQEGALKTWSVAAHKDMCRPKKVIQI